MDFWLSVDIFNNWSNKQEFKSYLSMTESESDNDKKLAKNLAELDKTFDKDLEVTDLTIRVLDFLVPYYKYISVKTLSSKITRVDSSSKSIAGEPFKHNDGRINGWPAIWDISLIDKRLSGSGGHHTKHCSEDILSKGIYKNYKGKFYKQVDIKVLKLLKEKLK